MYTWGFINRAVAEAADGMPTQALYALLAFISALCVNPPEAGAVGGQGWRMPTMAFGPRGEGMVSVLVVADEKVLLITQVAWLA